MKTLFRFKTWENPYNIGFNQIDFYGFIAHKKGFTQPWFSSLMPFANNKIAWHFFGFRFTKTPMHVSKERWEINGWYTENKQLINKLRKKL